MPTPVNPSPPALRRAVELSRQVITTAQAASGAYPAAVGFEPYGGFSWFRDGSFVADAMSRAGERASAEAFHGWCARVLEREAPAIRQLSARVATGEQPGDDELLPARYTLDGERHDDGWWNYQVDGYGTWLWALHTHARRWSVDLAPFAGAVEAATTYLVAFGARSCRDWWEEAREHTHVSTLACVYGGLRAAAGGGLLGPGLAAAATAAAAAIRDLVRHDGVHDGALRKWLGSAQVDGSLVVAGVPFGLVDPRGRVMAGTVARIENELSAPGQGIHRYRADTFYGGGQWPVLAGFVGLHHADVGNGARAEELLGWIVNTADADGALPEQVPPLLAPDRLAEWEQRWGPSARPLLWSHAMLVTLASELGFG